MIHQVRVKIEHVKSLLEEAKAKSPDAATGYLIKAVEALADAVGQLPQDIGDDEALQMRRAGL